MEDKWIALKQAEGERQTIYVRLDAISAIAPSGPGTCVWVHGTPVRVEETPQQVRQKLKSPKPLLGTEGKAKRG